MPVDLSTDQGYRLAKILQAIDDAEKDFAACRADHKERMTTLHNELAKVKQDILTGQKQLPLDPESAPVVITSEFAAKVETAMHEAGLTDVKVYAGSDAGKIRDAEEGDDE